MPRAIFAMFFTLLTALPAAAVELVMVEQPGCVYCERWDAEIAPIWPNSEAGQYAPLRRERLRAPPQDVDYARKVVFTPTFLIVEDGRELARLEGYPGGDFFWPLIEQLLEKHTGFEKGDS
ncbi:hypothetical protein SAMN04490248_106117 [Salinihabitans flavidus]|uniref:Regulatory protein SoxS n=1 Tax=Salinihabitans flavidus TaxID=569882 RepID=A0A1H8QDB1_9RHOB|nr:hypothetical protein [Salinihabitans flavidus]SEO52230.1 hypothetical protein SAMN04490248_106117 [Salinihabitans flavidus]